MSPSSFLYHCHLKTHPDSKYKVPISGCTHPLLSSCYHALYPAMFFNSNKNAEHKYVSLMFEASNYYASWDPLRPVRVSESDIFGVFRVYSILEFTSYTGFYYTSPCMDF